MKNKKFLRVLVALGLVGACCLALTGCSTSDYGYTGGVAATVNDVEIEEDTITKYIQDFRTTSEIDNDDDWASWMSENSMDPETVREQVIDFYVDLELKRQAAEEYDITVEDSEIDEYVENMKEYYESDEDWEEALTSAGLTEDQYRESIESGLYDEALTEEVAGDAATSTDDEVLEMLASYYSMFDGAKKSSHILFAADDEETAQEVLDKINSGELEFDEAAEEYSTDTSSAEDGGNVGWDCINTFVDEYTEALDDLSKGEVSELVESDYGIHIIKCTDTYSTDGSEESLDEWPDEFVEYITSIVESDNQSTAYDEWLEEYEEQADIVINDMPEEVPYNLDMSSYEDDEESDDSSDEESEDAEESDDESDDTDSEETDEEATTEEEEEQYCVAYLHIREQKGCCTAALFHVVVHMAFGIVDVPGILGCSEGTKAMSESTVTDKRCSSAALPPLFQLTAAQVRRGGACILDIDSFSLQQGENIALIGPNGAGKSTFIQLITREVFPLYKDTPPVLFKGNERPTLAEVKQCLGVVSSTMQQQARVHIPAEEVVYGGLLGSLGVPHWHTPSESGMRKARETLEFLGVGELAKRDMLTLSSGQARRVLIAKALVHNPEVLVFDEPTTGLDPEGMYYVRRAMRDLIAAGKSIILVTHYPEDIIPEINRVVMIKQGKIFGDYPKAEALTSARMSDLFDVPLRILSQDGYYSLVSEY